MGWFLVGYLVGRSGGFAEIQITPEMGWALTAAVPLVFALVWLMNWEVTRSLDREASARLKSPAPLR